MFLGDSNDQGDIRDNVINYSQILDWFFTERVRLFIGCTILWVQCGIDIDKSLLCYVIELTAHDLAKLKDARGLCELSVKAVLG